MDEHEIKAAALADKVGLSHVTIGNYLKGQPPKSEHLLAIARFFKVSMESLLLGVEKKIVEGAAMPKGWGGPYFGTSTMAPVIAFARGGAGAFPEDDGGDLPHIPVPCKDPHCYVLELEGESMQPLYNPGDLLVVSPSLQAQPGDLVIAKTVEDEVFFKRYQPKGKIIQMWSFNPKHPVMEFKPTDIRKIHPVHCVIQPLKGKLF